MSRARELQARLASTRETEGIVSAMRALALAHQKEAERHLVAVQAHATVVAGALADALAGAPPMVGGPRDGGALLIVAGAAQGFTGAYGDRLLKAALLQADETLVVSGLRTADALSASGRRPVWSAEAALHVADVPALASRVADAAFDLVARGAACRIAVLFATPADPAPRRQGLVPLDPSRVPAPRGAPPVLTLPRDALLARLVEEWAFAGICEALMLGFAAENAARVEAMSRATTNIRRIAAELESGARLARQEELTTEIVDLGLDASP